MQIGTVDSVVSWLRSSTSTEWTEMAALCPGVQYGLSTAENFSENKTLIFVKLTDSAYSAVQEYIQNQKHNKSPTIKFLGDEGQITIPSLQNEKSFKFSMSSTADIEGPGGGFECVQQSGPPRGSLQVLGTMPHKIRIHANEDVYETTRKRMSVAEENHKNKCTREIKPNQTDIGRKVKVKQLPGRPIPPVRREPPAIPSVRDNLLKPSYQSSMPSKPLVHSNNGLSNGLGNNNNHVNSRIPNNKPSLPDIAKRPIKERMIQLLALRPYKKPELYDRLSREGLREKKAVGPVLKQIAFLKDNAYHLNRSLWSDVNENWPFYTESEKQILKRRKPQNLTPPGSSDGGSSGSGHSPTSTHPGSPPPPITLPKRPGYYDGNDGLPTKRPRISHYQKTSDHPPPYRSPVDHNNSQRRPPTDSRDASNMNPRSRESPNEYGGSSNLSSSTAKRNLLCDDDNIITTNKGAAANVAAPRNNRGCDSLPPGSATKYGTTQRHSANFNGSSYAGTPPSNAGGGGGGGGGALLPVARDSRNGDSGERPADRADRERPTRWSNGDSPLTGQSRTSIVESLPVREDVPAPPHTELPDYLTEYTTIMNAEQRRQYKEDFAAHYDEYKKLHAMVEKVSRRFEELEERLRNEAHSRESLKDIKKQIMHEYHKNMRDHQHKQVKDKFQQLHDKLAHIKNLVSDYDRTHGPLKDNDHY